MQSFTPQINAALHRISQLRQHLERYGRPMAFALLLLLTVYGGALFFLGEYSELTAGWQRHALSLAIAISLSMLNVCLDGFAWMTLCRRFHCQMFDRWGVCVFLSSFAASLLPMKAGRLLRPDGIGRLHRGRRLTGVQVEGVALFFEGTSALSIIAFVAAWHFRPEAGPFAALAVSLAFFLAADRIASLVAGTPLALPRRFWWSWQTWGLYSIAGLGWLIDGLVFYTIIQGFPGALTMMQCFALTPAAALAGSGSGIPGGVGVVEGIMGVTLSISEMPGPALAFSVAAFRLANFWLWIPVGWTALSLLNRKIRLDRATADQTPQASKNFS